MRLVFVSLCLLAALLPAAAQTVKPTAAPPKLTLAQALSAVPPPADGLRLTVGADKATLPDGADAPPAGATLSDVTAAFGDITVNFGDVVAVAPASMVLLNPSPGPPDIASDMSATTALSLLAASLTDPQWAALTSEHGLGLSDLTDDTQRSLFHALFPGGHLYVGSEDPALADLPPEKRTDVRDDTDQIDTTRVRLTQTAHLYLHNTSGGTISFTGSRPDAASRLHTYRPKALPLSVHHAVSLWAEVPNTLKPSDLDWDSKALQVSVPLAGLKTVGDLVTRIGQGSGLELYADLHYAAKTLTLSGPMTTVPAGDLLRAVCVCITGTFRKVGPAYVLTDDVIGVGVRRKHLKDWEDQSNQSENGIRNKLAPTMLERHAADVRKIKAFDDPLGLTPEQVTGLSPDPVLGAISGILDTDYPFTKLTPAQQAWMKQRGEAYEEEWQKDPPSNNNAGNDGIPDFTHNVSLRMDMRLQMLVPSESQPVDTNQRNLLFSLFYPDEATMIEMAKAKGIDAGEKANTLAKLPPPPPLSPLLHAGQRRAVLAHPYSAAEVDALVIAMQKLGLNQLWLNVFSGGANHIKTSAAYGKDILTEALNKTRGTGIQVYAHLNLLTWGAEPPDNVRDLTIDGKDSRQQAIEDNEASPYPNYDDDDNLIPFVAPSVTVSPAAPAVGQTLSSLMQDLAAKPELAGIVWEDAETSSDLGYTPLLRLAFLRDAHADPVDIADPGASRIDLSLPLFDDAKADAALPGQWAHFTNAADTSLLRSLRAAAWRGSGPPLTLLLQQNSDNDDDSFIDWNDPKQPPSLKEQQADGFYVPPDKITALFKTPGRIALRRETIKNDRDIPTLARKLKEDAKRLPGSGFVLDFAQESVTQGTTPLDSLVDAVRAEKAGSR